MSEIGENLSYILLPQIKEINANDVKDFTSNFRTYLTAINGKSRFHAFNTKSDESDSKRLEQTSFLLLLNTHVLQSLKTEKNALLKDILKIQESVTNYIDESIRIEKRLIMTLEQYKAPVILGVEYASLYELAENFFMDKRLLRNNRKSIKLSTTKMAMNYTNDGWSFFSEKDKNRIEGVFATKLIKRATKLMIYNGHVLWKPEMGENEETKLLRISFQQSQSLVDSNNTDYLYTFDFSPSHHEEQFSEDESTKNLYQNYIKQIKDYEIREPFGIIVDAQPYHDNKKTIYPISGQINHAWNIADDENSLSDMKSYFGTEILKVFANLMISTEGEITTIRPLKKGEELMIDYGESYWRFRPNKRAFIDLRHFFKSVNQDAPMEIISEDFILDCLDRIVYKLRYSEYDRTLMMYIKSFSYRIHHENEALRDEFDVEDEYEITEGEPELGESEDEEGDEGDEDEDLTNKKEKPRNERFDLVGLIDRDDFIENAYKSFKKDSFVRITLVHDFESIIGLMKSNEQALKNMMEHKIGETNKFTDNVVKVAGEDGKDYYICMINHIQQI
jgi:hypothetical protein